MFKKRIHQLIRLIEDIFVFFKMKYIQNPTLKDKVLYVDFENPNLYHRFFYLLLKFYNLSGYSIIYPMSFSKFRNLRNGDHYLSLIMKESNFLIIKDVAKKDNFININDSQFSPDYFKNYFENNNLGKNTFHIPMSFHPLMYHNQLWNKKITSKKARINSIFCYGNFDDKAYLEIERTDFKVINRLKLYEFFKRQNGFHWL